MLMCLFSSCRTRMNNSAVKLRNTLVCYYVVFWSQIMQRIMRRFHDLCLTIFKINIIWNACSLSVCVLKVFGIMETSVPTWCNLITVDLGMRRQCPRRAVQNASREHPVLGDRNIRCDRWLINHGGACTVTMGGLPLESTLWSRWAEGASAQQHEPWTHCHCDWVTACCHHARIRWENMKKCYNGVTLCAFSWLTYISAF